MARKSFALNTVPHVAEIGDVELLFRPEVMGDEFLDAYEAMREKHKLAGVTGEPSDMTADQLRETTRAVRKFVADLMFPESAEQFAEMPLPDRIVVGLLEWTLEIYGGNGGQRPPTSSSASSTASRTPGTRGTGSSRSKASTRTAGR